MGRPRCYVASPLGFSEPGRHYLESVLVPALREVVEVVDPWSFPSAGAVSGRSLALELGRRNAEAIDGCSLLVAVLDGQEVDSGTASEVGYAAARGLRLFGLRSDFRESGEEGVAVNLQVEYFISASGGVVARSLDELVGALRG